MFRKFLICVSYLLICASCVYATDETLTITTYYPSPYGSYREVSAYRMKIGTDYSDAAYSVSDNHLIVQGNVGIGTASPGYKLDINVGSDRLRLAGGNPGILFTGVGNNMSILHSNPELIYIRDETAGATRFMIDQSGNLGIGTASPTQKLDVAGNMQANLYYDKENTAYYIDPNATSNVYRMQVNYPGLLAANDVITKQYADNNYKDPPGQWTCTVRYGEWKEYQNCPGTPISTAYCVGNEKVINGGGDGAGIIGWHIEHGWKIDATGVCNWGGRVRAAAYCCQ